jgi:hypothetical protein
MKEHIPLSELSSKTLTQDDGHELSILPAIPREPVNNTARLEREQDVKACLSSRTITSLSRQATNGSRPTTNSSSSGRPDPRVNAPTPVLRGIRKIGFVLVRHLKFVGPGLVSSVAYFDP